MIRQAISVPLLFFHIDTEVKNMNMIVIDMIDGLAVRYKAEGRRSRDDASIRTGSYSYISSVYEYMIFARKTYSRATSR